MTTQITYCSVNNDIESNLGSLEQTLKTISGRLQKNHSRVNQDELVIIYEGMDKQTYSMAKVIGWCCWRRIISYRHQYIDLEHIGQMVTKVKKKIPNVNLVGLELITSHNDHNYATRGNGYAYTFVDKFTGDYITYHDNWD